MMVRLVHVTTVAQSLNFLRGQAGYMRRAGIETYAIASPSPGLDQFSVDEDVPVIGVEMRRAIAPVADCVAVVRLVRILRRLRPEIVHAHTPKGGLLGMVAATLARVPVRIYQIHGLRFDTARGWRRAVLMATEWVSCRLAHQVLCVSTSTLTSAERAGVCAIGHGKVLGAGSINGVDAHFQFDPLRAPGRGSDIRRSLNIPTDAKVVGFVGRLVKDKGFVDLVGCWRGVRARYPESHLLIVGAAEPDEPLPETVFAELAADDRVHLVGWVEDPAPYYAAMNLLALPSHREGFGLAAVEAAAMRVPVVATRINGLVDSIVDGVTGILVPPSAPEELLAAIERYLDDEDLCVDHAFAGRIRVLDKFDQGAMWKVLRGEYGELSANCA